MQAWSFNHNATSLTQACNIKEGFLPTEVSFFQLQSWPRRRRGRCRWKRHRKRVVLQSAAAVTTEWKQTSHPFPASFRACATRQEWLRQTCGSHEWKRRKHLAWWSYSVPSRYFTVTPCYFVVFLPMYGIVLIAGGVSWVSTRHYLYYTIMVRLFIQFIVSIWILFRYQS